MTTTRKTDEAATRTAAETYFSAWKARDFDRLRSVLADGVSFRGPLGTADGPDECVKGIEGMSQIVTDIDVKAVTVDGEDVVTMFELHTRPAPPMLTANWSRVRDGRIAQIRVAFDPRPLLDAS
ncbi:hypothetical protein DSM112329_04619 [Paraconexibacter sp. AEG42_29]|uniref:SnoaL-like domain-containing protein n=1 Tax=Paraconexibacter sp. AEG42_29 TaxID=2997339 RepID=A0AAU7B2G6_9ACTN